MTTMGDFDFNDPAEVFTVTRVRGKHHPVTYQRFPTTAEAIRHVVEVLEVEKRDGAILETEVARYDATEIEALYERPDYPLVRLRH